MTKKPLVASTVCLFLICNLMNTFGQPKSKLKERTKVYIWVIQIYPKAHPRAKAKPTVTYCWIKGGRLRMEDRIEGKVTRIMIAPEDGFLYQLFPASRAGVKQETSPSDLIRMLAHIAPDPTTRLRYWRKWGMKKIGSEKLSGQECDIYLIPQSQGISKTKIWVRRRDGLVVKEKLEGVEVTVRELKGFKVDVPVSDSMFLVPKGYKLEEMLPGGPPPLQGNRP